MNTKLSAVAAIAAAAAIALGATGCSSSQPQPAKPNATPDAAHAPAQAAAGAISFFAAATSDTVAKMDPASPNPGVFDDAIKHVDPSSDSVVLADALGNLAALKVAAGAAKLDLKVDEAKVKVDGDTATIPADAITIEQDGQKAANSDTDAAALTHLVYRAGTWDITFKKDAPATDAPTAAATPSPTASK